MVIIKKKFILKKLIKFSILLKNEINSSSINKIFFKIVLLYKQINLF